MSNRPARINPAEVVSGGGGDGGIAKMLSPSQSRPVPPRGLSRTEAAMYLGVSPSKFDELVEDHRMPQPRLIDRRKVWDVHELDMAFDELPREGSPPLAGNSWADRM
jgi:excisionase family DNA binding protein